MLKMTHAIYLVSNVDIAQQFLGGVLGLLVTNDELTVSGERFLTMGSESFGVELQIVEFSAQAEIATLKKSAGVVDFILQPADAVAFMALVENAGLTIHREPIEAAYGITAIFEDPFGNLWDVVQRTDS
jgi:catechol 2,3-dioxygenase-like lactoylglutathione lyase family enzyme